MGPARRGASRQSTSCSCVRQVRPRSLPSNHANASGEARQRLEGPIPDRNKTLCEEEWDSGAVSTAPGARTPQEPGEHGFRRSTGWQGAQGFFNRADQQRAGNGLRR